MAFWYLSFVDPGRPKGDKFLGATIIAADDEEDAIRKTHRLGTNPGGEVMLAKIPDDLETHPDVMSLLNRLVGREEMLKIGRPMTEADWNQE